MPNPPGLLLLVAELIKEPALRQAFNANPSQVMLQFGLSKTERECLFSMDRGEIGSLISAQIQSVAFPVGEFPATDVNCLPEPGGGTPAYPDPTPSIHRVRPNAVAVGDTNVEIVVHGQSFPPDARVRLEQGNTVRTLTGDLIGTYRCSKLRIVIPSVPNAMSGTWDLYVEGNLNASNAHKVTAGPKPVVVS